MSYNLVVVLIDDLAFPSFALSNLTLAVFRLSVCLFGLANSEVINFAYVL